MSILLSSALATQALYHFDSLLLGSYVLTAVAIYATAALAYYLLYRVVLWPNFFSPLRNIAGPRTHWFYGNFREILKEPAGVCHLAWQKQYPDEPFIRYHGLFHQERLLVNTQSAHQYILTNCYDYPKPESLGATLKNILGAEGVLFAEGDVHKRQRKQMNPSFSYSNLRSMVPIFNSKSYELVNAWSQMLKRGPEIEVLQGMSSTTLDIIGSAGFGYEFNSVAGLTDEAAKNPLAAAYEDMFDVKKISRVLGLIVFFLPWVRVLPFPRHVEIDRNIAIVKKMSRDIVTEKYAMLSTGQDSGNDIFALLLKDNMRKEFEKDPLNPPMTLTEVGDQTTTLLAAGHETTSAGTTWALHALSIHQDMQVRLRDELSSVLSPDEPPTFEQIEGFHYLNNFVKEVLRFYPPVPITRREAKVSATVEGRYIPAGTQIFICPAATNKNPRIWGPDGEAFNPDRWENLPSTHNNYGMETFLHGARGCIGQKFAIIEMKCLLVALVMNLQFDPKPGHVVESASSLTMRPKGGLPLLVTKI